MSYNKMKFTVGLFVLSTFVLLFVFLLLFLQEKGSFEDRYKYNFTTSSAEYFTVGMPVKFSGFTIGSIEKIHLQDDGYVKMFFSVNEKNVKWLTDGSILLVIKPLLGSPYVNLYTSLGTSPLADGSSIHIEISDNINDLVVRMQPAVKKAIRILDNVEKITTFLASEESELKKILINLNKFSSSLAKNDAILTSITGDKKATEDLVKSLHETSLILKDIKKITATLQSDIIEPSSSSIKELELILKDVKKKLETLNGTVEAVGKSDSDLIEIKNQITAGIQKSNQIMDKVDALMQNKSSSEVVLP